MSFNIPISRLSANTSLSLYKYGVFFCLFVIVDIITFQVDNVHYCLIVLGETPSVGGTGMILVILLYYVLFFSIRFLNNSLRRFVSLRVANVIIALYLSLPFVMLFVYCELYSNYAENIELKYMRLSHKCVGVVYSQKSPGYRSHHYTIRTGIDSVHTCEQRVADVSILLKNIHIGDTIILRVSDEYPRVNRVLNWHPTHEEIEKYRTPVKLIEGDGL